MDKSTPVTRRFHYLLLAANRCEARRVPAKCFGPSARPAVMRKPPTGMEGPSLPPSSPRAMETFKGVAAASLRTLPSVRT